MEKRNNPHPKSGPQETREPKDSSDDCPGTN